MPKVQTPYMTPGSVSVSLMSPSISAVIWHTGGPSQLHVGSMKPVHEHSVSPYMHGSSPPPGFTSLSQSSPSVGAVAGHISPEPPPSPPAFIPAVPPVNVPAVP